MIPIADFETGNRMEAHSFTWTIKNFPVVIADPSLVESHEINFTAGNSIGLSSKWKMFLHRPIPDEPKHIVVFLQLIENTPTMGQDYLLVGINVCLGTEKGETLLLQRNSSEVMQVRTSDNKTRWPIGDLNAVLDHFNDYLYKSNHDLPIRVKFNLYSTETESKIISQPAKKVKVTLADAIKELKEKFDVKTGEAYAKLFELPIESKEWIIISSNGKEFRVTKGILSARSPVFAAMLESNMIEGNEGIINIPDISGESMKILLHYIYTGELLPEWKTNDVIGELMYAADKYELTDLFNFFDKALVEVCSLETVGSLIALAHKLSMKTAESELLTFAKEKGAASAANFLKMIGIDNDEGDVSSPDNEVSSTNDDDGN